MHAGITGITALAVKSRLTSRLPCWEIITDNLHDAGFSLGWVSALDIEGRTTWIVAAHRDETRFIVRADEILTAFMELEAAICTGAKLS